MLDHNKIYHGDCLELMRDIDDHSVDMILADLPYGTTACAWDSIIDLDLLWGHYKRAIKPRGAIVLTASQPFTTMLINAGGLDWFKYEWFWEKERGTGFATVAKQPLKIIEEVCVFYKNGVTYNPQNIPLKKPYKHILPRTNSKSGGKATLKTVKTGKDVYKIYTHSSPNTLLSFARDNATKTPHPTQKPIALFSYLIKTYTNPGDLVLDNAAGSGTTAIAAIETGRNWICMEKDDHYFEVAQARIQERLKQPFLPGLVGTSNQPIKPTPTTLPLFKDGSAE